jgi:hypothetical protein
MISEIVTLMARWKSCQPRTHPIQVLKFAEAMSFRQSMNFFGKIFREQILLVGCLSDRLSGNGQELLNAPIPAPGGDQ